MRTRPKSCGPSRYHAFRRIARRGIPFTAVGDCAFIALPAQSFKYHSSGRAFMIDRFASQNFQPSLQPKAENRFTPTREMHLAPRLCVTTPARHPVAVALRSLPSSGKHLNLPCIPPLPTLRDKIKILPTMERASKLIRGLRLSGDVITPEQLCCAAWPEAVGKKIAGHTRPAKLVRSRLVVEVEDHTWQRQLFALTPHILSNLDKTLGRGLVEDLEFRIVPRRREPVVAVMRTIPDSPWSLVALMDTAEVYAPLREQLRLIEVLISALLLSAGAVVGLVWWQQSGRFYRAKYEAEEGRSKLAAIVEFSEDAIIGESLDGTITSWNAGAERLFGYHASEMIGQQITRIIPPNAQAQEAESLNRLRDGKRVEQYEAVRVAKDGRPVAVSMTISPIFDVAGTLIGAAKIARDITARKREEEALREEQALFNNLASTIPDRIYFKDRQSRFVRINEAMVRFFGLRSAPEAVGKTDFNFFTEEHARRAYEVEQRVMTKGEPLIGLEEKETWIDGRVTWVSTTKVALRDADGNITGLVGISRDITERKRTEERIREQAALLDNANDAIYVRALDRTILYWNRGAERTYGWTSAEVLNRKSTELISPELGADSEALTAILLEKGSWSGERRLTTKSGGNVEVFSRLTLVRDEQGRSRSILVIDTDITEKKEIEARFLRAQRLESIGSLASGIAHDLNNVLAPIIMGAPLLQGMVEDETVRHLLKTMESSAQRGAAIVKQVLTFARGVEGERVPLDPRELLGEMKKLAAETFPKGIRIDTDVGADLWLVLGDATQLHQALMNLCINARDAMPEGGVLTIGVVNIVLSKEKAEKIPGAQPGSFVCFRIIDTGMGIPPEIKAKIFEPFFTTKGVGKGTGLGLSTVLGIVRSHGGFVQVASKVGQGSTFELYLPATKVGHRAVKTEPITSWPHARGECILVVDDEAAVREIARQALIEFGYQVITAGNGAAALRIFEEHRRKIRLVLTDMMMPEMDGPTLVAALRVLDPAVRIVGITGMIDTASMSALKTLTLSAMLAKPFTIEKLLAAIREALSVTAG